jgi:diguanylate cyclase (GGDEF)-like protein
MISTLKYYTKKNEPIGIILISLSNVSEINDKCGYEFGDIFLKEFSDFLASSFGKKNSFRYTNTEFVIILQDKEHTNYNEAIGVIKSKIENGWIICGETSNVECSFATMEFPNSLKSFEDIITVLDHYTSKSKNVLNREVLYVSDDILLSIKRRNMVIQELRNQVLSQTIIVEYQPIYSLKKKRYLNIEALMRLNIKNFGSISPNEFIPLAEDTYLIIELGNILVSEVCNLMKMLEENNIQYEKLSVNISSIQLFDKAFAKNLTRILKDNDISANKLNLELTESIMISDYDDLYNTIKELRSRGFGISLDDYGTGYSNYVKLAKLPFDEIKIDKSILHYIMSVETEYITLSNIIKGFKNRGLNIVMEGVETEEHYKISNALSVDLIQGYYFSRPLEKEELIRFLITSN